MKEDKKEKHKVGQIERAVRFCVAFFLAVPILFYAGDVIINISMSYN